VEKTAIIIAKWVSAQNTERSLLYIKRKKDARKEREFWKKKNYVETKEAAEAGASVASILIPHNPQFHK
jgi:hypothetical protein